MTSPKRIMVVDDDPTMRTALTAALSSGGYETAVFSSGSEAEPFLKRGDCDLVVSDVRMPGLDGMELLKRFKQIPFIMISGFATVPEAVEAMKAGAFDFIVKPFSYRELLPLIGAALCHTERSDDSVAHKGEFVSHDGRVLQLLEFSRQVAKSHASILIQGESGTGKELLARYIHGHSRRCDGPFVAVNCAALPEGLLESELFGHERGAFTGAVMSKPGKFELANFGTLLLDEITEMPLSLQAKLLRVLQEREVDRIGGKKPVPVDIRVIATTNRDVREMIRTGGFRDDLFYRLNVVPLRLPPLRERLDDIESLADSFFATRGYPQARLSGRALSLLRSHSWRGNVRELFNVLERAAILADGGSIAPDHLLLDDEIGAPSSLVPLAMGLPDSSQQTRSSTWPVDGAATGASSVRAMEQQLINRTLAQTNNNRTQAARILGISVRTLRNKLKLYREREAAEV